MIDKNISKTEALFLLSNPNAPFSPILNRLIELKFDMLPFDVKFCSGQPYATYEAMRYDVNQNNRMRVSMDHSERTIFGSPLINWKFRAVHDSYHIKHDLGFGADDERQLNNLTLSELSEFGLPRLEMVLLHIEMCEQVNYFEQFGDFPTNQRVFAMQGLSEIGLCDLDLNTINHFENF